MPGIYPHQSAQANVGREFAISPDGKLLVAVSEEDIGRPATIYSTETWQELRRVNVSGDILTSLAITLDSRKMAIGTVGGTIDIFDLADRIIGSCDRWA